MNQRELPHSQEAEQGILGCTLWSPNDCLNECALKIGDDLETFYDLRLRTIYETMTQLANEMKPVEVISVCNSLKDRGVLDQVGGWGFVSSLQDSVPSAANLSYYLDIVIQKRILRKAIRTCEEITRQAYSGEDVDSLMDRAEREILDIRDNRGASSEAIKSICKDAINRLEEMAKTKGRITGYPTGLADLDRITDGIHGGEMVVIAAFPSCGKTALAMQIGVHNAKEGVGVAVFSCEMRPSSLTLRAICSEARVNRYDIRDGTATEQDYARIISAAGTISKLPLFIENANGWSIGQVLAKSRRLKQQHNIGLVVIDYIQLLSSDAGSREQEVSAISKGIKSIAVQLNVGVIALSQLNDDGKLRESRAIGQDADSVWKLEIDGEWEPRDQPMKLVVEKNREGETGTVGLMFKKTVTRFEMASKIKDEDVPC